MYTLQTLTMADTDVDRANDEYLKWQKLGKQRDPEAWEMYPSMVNAYFNPPANEVRAASRTCKFGALC